MFGWDVCRNFDVEAGFLFLNADLVHVVWRDEEVCVSRGYMCSVGTHHSLLLLLHCGRVVSWALKFVGPGRHGDSVRAQVKWGVASLKTGGDSSGKLHFPCGPELVLNSERRQYHPKKYEQARKLSCPTFSFIVSKSSCLEGKDLSLTIQSSCKNVTMVVAL